MEIPEWKKERRATVQLWDGWYFENNLIVDDAGNKYTQRDIHMSWQAGLIIDGKIGLRREITSLKFELEHKIRMQGLPEICFIWEDEKGITERVFNLKEKL